MKKSVIKNSPQKKAATTQSSGSRRSKSQYKKKSDKVYLSGVIIESLPGVKFKVKIERPKSLEPLILVCDTWSFFKSRIKLIRGDAVEVELDPQDLTKGVIINRM